MGAAERARFWWEPRNKRIAPPRCAATVELRSTPPGAGPDLLGHPMRVAEAMVLESLGQAVRSVGFVLPGGLGAQESGIVAAGIMLGIDPDLALAVALIKRARELAYGVPGLIAWSVVDLAGCRA